MKKIIVIVLIVLVLINLGVIMSIKAMINISYESDISVKKEARKLIISQNDNVEKVSFYGISPTLFVDLELSKPVEVNEVKKVFESVRSIILEEEMYLDIKEWHENKHHGTMVDIYITIFVKDDDKYWSYIFDSSIDQSKELAMDGFSKWSFKYDGKTIDYVPLSE